MDIAREKIQGICNDSGGRSELFAQGTQGYLNAIAHYYPSSSQAATFAVEPGSTGDLSKIVKGGGHTSNPTFSSTTGIHISLLRLNKLSLSENEQQLTVGAGCWADQIYKYILPQGYNIVAGSGTVGISGWSLGGGYSRITSQYGLGIDNIVQADVVLPHGPVMTASETVNADLFWAIKGGGNNFGIATEFILKTHEHGKVYGGLLSFDEDHVEKVKAAILAFTTQQDCKANIEAAFRSYFNNYTGVLEFKIAVLALYDGAKPQTDPFKGFLDIPHQGRLEETSYTTLDTAATLVYKYIRAEDAISAYDDLLANRSPTNPGGDSGSLLPIGIETPLRARWGNVMVFKYTPALVSAVEAETRAANELMETHNGKMAVADVWPFLPTEGTDSAWPHKAHNEFILVYFVWEGEQNDSVWISQLEKALDRIRQVALQQECAKVDAPVYSNTSLADVTTPRQIYQNHLADLVLLKGIYDPHNVMKNAGGYRISSGLMGNITNAKDGATVGVKTLPGPIKTDDINKKIFEISPASDKPGEFLISIKDGSIKDGSIKDGSIIYSAVEDGSEIRCDAQQSSTWRLVPKARSNDQFNYLIQSGSRYWVLRDGQVKTTTDTSGVETLWRFNFANA